MFDFFKKMLSDSNDNVSSKRTIAFLAFLICAVSLIGEQFFNFKADTTLFQYMMYIVVAGLGFTASEKFAPK